MRCANLREALNELKALPAYVRSPTRRMIGALRSNPYPPKAKELDLVPSLVEGMEVKNVYRIWIAGKWRLAYHIDDEERAVTILAVAPKTPGFYDTVETRAPQSQDK